MRQCDRQIVQQSTGVFAAVGYRLPEAELGGDFDPNLIHGPCAQHTLGTQWRAVHSSLEPEETQVIVTISPRLHTVLVRGVRIRIAGISVTYRIRAHELQHQSSRAAAPVVQPICWPQLCELARATCLSAILAGSAMSSDCSRSSLNRRVCSCNTASRNSRLRLSTASHQAPHTHIHTHATCSAKAPGSTNKQTHKQHTARTAVEIELTKSFWRAKESGWWDSSASSPS